VKDPKQSLKGKSFIWALFLFLIFFSCAAIWGGMVGLSKTFCLFLLAVSGSIPFLIMFLTGYTIDGMWVLRHSKTERPVYYWVSITLSAILALWFGFAAYSMYVPGQ
jgi:hypothetical protein